MGASPHGKGKVSDDEDLEAEVERELSRLKVKESENKMHTQPNWDDDESQPAPARVSAPSREPPSTSLAWDADEEVYRLNLLIVQKYFGICMNSHESIYNYCSLTVQEEVDLD